MNPNSPEQPQSSPSTEPISTEWDSSATFIEKTPEEHLPPEALRDIGKKALQEITTPDSQELSSEAPEDYKTAPELAGKLRVSYRTIKTVAQRLNINGQEFRNKNVNNRLITYYSPEEQAKIENELSSETPEGYKTAPELASELGVSKSTIRDTVQRLNINGQKFKNKNANNRLITYYSPEEQATIENELFPEKIPEGYKTAPELAGELGVDYITIRNSAQRLNINGQEFRKKGSKHATYYSPEEQVTIENELSSEIPEGYKTAKELASELGVSKSTIRSAAQRLNINGQEFRKKGSKHATYYSPEEQVTIENELFPEIPKGYKTVQEIADELEVGRETVRAVTQKLNINGQKFRGKNSQPTTYYSPEEQVTIENELSSEIPEGYKTAKDLADELGFHESTIWDTAKKLNINGQKFRGKNGQPTTYYSPEEQVKIENELSSEIPEGYKIVQEIADELEVGRETVRRAAQKLNINGQKFRGKNSQPTTYYSPEEQARIKHEVSPEIPEGYKTAPELASEFGVSNQTIRDAAQRLGIKGQEIKGKSGQPTTYYSPEEQARIKHEVSPEIPEGYKTVKNLANELEVYENRIRNAVQRLGIEGQKFRGKNGQSTTYFSPGDQAEIIEELENVVSGSSFPECAFVFYLQQAGIKIEQGIRPDWMKNPDTDRNLEVDIFIPFDNPPPLGIGIEYDGAFWHKDPDYDVKKNSLSRRGGVEIIHIRENGCPELPENIPCILRQDESNEDLSRSIEQLFTMLGIPLSKAGIDIKRDTKEINDLKNRNRTIQTFDDMTEETIDKAA